MQSKSIKFSTSIHTRSNLEFWSLINDRWKEIQFYINRIPFYCAMIVFMMLIWYDRLHHLQFSRRLNDYFRLLYCPFGSFLSKISGSKHVFSVFSSIRHCLFTWTNSFRLNNLFLFSTAIVLKCLFVGVNSSPSIRLLNDSRTSPSNPLRYEDSFCNSVLNESPKLSPNSCLCYGSSQMGVFVECSSTDIKQINDTLKILNNSTDSQKIRSLSIYSLSDTGSVKQLPDFLFQTFNALSELHISKTNLSSIGTQQTYSGLENSLQSLSFVNSKISTIPKTTLNKLIKLKSFDVQSNQIDVLDSYAFYGLPLRILNLQNNLIKKIQEFAFGGLENTLEELILNGNRLENFPLFSLRRLRKLSTLKMQNNQINQIPDDGFTRFTLLETLDLQSNRIRHLNSRSFLTMPKLKILYCSNNLLTVVSDSAVFAQLHFLETLDLSLNRLRVVNLDGLRSVRTLDISHNHLHDLRLQGLIGLRELFASHNNILQLLNETFANTEQIEVIYLQFNSIQTISYNTFFRLTQLRILDLSNNQLKQLDSSVFKFTNRLESLYLDSNILADSGLEPGIFQELIDLEDLRLQNNHLQHIRKGVFYSLPNLKNLDLQMNRIESIESFESLANIQNINLQGNRLRTFNGNVLSSFHSSLSYLNLANNQLISIENDTFRNRNKLEIIWLNHNQIKQISANAFDGLSGAEKLYLDHNKINFIEEKAFFSMKSLTYLNLEYNQLAHLTRNMFEGLESLIELRLKSSEIIGIEANFLSCFKLLQILDLSDNRIYSIRKNMFQSGDSITELYLSNAMIDEIEKDSFANLQSLRLLDLSRNSINARQMNVLKLPGSIKKLNISWNNLSNEKGTKLNANFINQLGSSLEILDLSSTQFDLSDTQNFFSSLTNLRELYLNGNEIDKIENGSFPIETGLNYPSILTITLDTNHLETIPSNQIIAKFAPSLHSFSLAQNQIKKISSNAFFGLKKLQRLDLSTNRISIIESFAFNGLDRLQHLDLSGNVLRTLSDHVFDNLPNLSRLSLAKNWLQFIPTNFIRSETNRSFSSTTSVTTKIELDIAHNPLVRLIESSNLKLNFKTNSDIYDHIRIFELLILNAENGNLTLISAEDFRPFPSLIVLKLKQNLIRTILPASFLPLSKLSVLDLSVNKLESFSSDQLNGLNRLEHLNVSHNLLIESPSFVSEIQKLQSLDISYNRISRIESFGHLSDSLKHLYIRHNMISYIADNAFQNLTSLRMIDLRENFLTQISDNIFESIEVRLETILFSGNPFKCDCQLLSIYRWLEEHQRLVRKIQDDLIKAELICDQPERLKNVPITSLQPVDFCPIPIITLLKVIDLDSNSLRLMWDVQNETLVSGFTLEYYLTSERSLTSPAGLHVNSGTRSAELRDLMADKWYTLCVEAKGKSSRPQPSPLSSLSSVSIEKNLDPSRTKIMQLIENPPIVDYMISDPPDQKKLLLKDFVAGNHKCLQAKTLSSINDRNLIELSFTSTILSVAIFSLLLLLSCTLTLTIRKFKHRSVPQQSKSKHNDFGISSSSSSMSLSDSNQCPISQIRSDPLPSSSPPARSATMISFGSISASPSTIIAANNESIFSSNHFIHHQQQQQQHPHNCHVHPIIHQFTNEEEEMSELNAIDVIEDFITYRHFPLPSNESVYQ